MSIFRQIRSVLGKTEKPQVEAVEEPSGPVERRSRQRLNSNKGRRVMIIDDSPTIVAALRKMLRSAGCITHEALNAESGLTAIRDEKPDLVFLDIVLPGMNGFAALRLLRRDPLTQNIPVIMISGNEQATEQFYAKRIGADDFMKKPFSRFEVFARIDALVDQGKLARIMATPEITPETQPALPQTSPPVVKERPAAEKPAEARDRPTTTSQLEARKQLTAMGLQYFNYDQFSAAIERGDKLAVELFMTGGGVKVSA